MKNNLKQLRLDAGLTMQELADKVGTCKSQIHCLEKDGSNPTLKAAHNISIALSYQLGREIRINDVFMFIED